METMKKNQNAEEDSDENDEEESNDDSESNEDTNRRHRGIRLGSRNVMSLFSVKLSMVRNAFPFRLGLKCCDCTTKGEDRPTR